MKRAIILKEKPLLAGVRDGNFSKKIGAPSIMIQMECFRWKTKKKLMMDCSFNRILVRQLGAVREDLPLKAKLMTMNKDHWSRQR